jgi:hypothetical protein
VGAGPEVKHLPGTEEELLVDEDLRSTWERRSGRSQVLLGEGHRKSHDHLGKEIVMLLARRSWSQVRPENSEKGDRNVWFDF